ncbi:hypothetical protein EVAR_60621_1 [Eumeta japonica]|uniref:Uncharacterized protein n=1 Tax=Eumeta variegata TaxID=151549 RepID=A0A4C1SPK1_EUMVA|nr:hypothetical protein EVAR_60621_1 [Eumeta japonica]
MNEYHDCINKSSSGLLQPFAATGAGMSLWLGSGLRHELMNDSEEEGLCSSQRIHRPQSVFYDCQFLPSVGTALPPLLQALQQLNFTAVLLRQLRSYPSLKHRVVLWMRLIVGCESGCASCDVTCTSRRPTGTLLCSPIYKADFGFISQRAIIGNS